MSQDINRAYVPGTGLSLYFQWRDQIPDFTIEPSEVGTPTERIKLSNQLRTYRQIKDEIDRPGFKQIERQMFDTVRLIEGEYIWDAIDRGDQAEIGRLNARRKGIVEMFATFRSIGDLIQGLENRIDNLKNQEDEPLEREALEA